MSTVTLKTQIINSSESFFINKSLYEFQPDRKYRWLQKLCFRVLDWIGAHHQETTKTLSISAPPEDIIAHLLAQKAVVRLFHKDGPTRVIMGPNNFKQLQDRKDCWQYMELPRVFGKIGYYGEYRVFGLDITIVPWLNGVLVLP